MHASRLSLSALALVVVLCWAVPARAQPTLGLVPPELTHFEEAIVDAAAFEGQGEVSVLLEIDVLASGEVSDVRLVEGDGEPFDLAALAAARLFVFEPAQRDGAPIAARIRYRYTFTPPPPPEPASEPPAEAAAPDASPVPETSPDELDLEVAEFTATAEVEAPPREVVRYDIERAQVQRLAGAHGDALRATELMPGVTAAPYVDGGGIVVRGSHPLDTQVLVEGAPSPLLNHFGGYTSFFNSRLLDRVELYPGNFSVRFGRALGAVIDVTVRDSFRDGFHGGADLNVIDASLFAEGGAPEVSGAVAVRRSWIDAIYGAVLGDDNLVSAPVYYDYQGIVRYAPGRDDVLRLLVYGSHDDVALRYDEPGRDVVFQGDIRNATQFHRGQLEWRHRYSPSVRHDVRLMAGYLGYDQQIGRLLSASDEGLELNLRTELTATLDERVSLIVGYDGWAHHLNVTYEGPPAPAPEGDPAGFGFDDPRVTGRASTVIARSAVYVESRISPLEAWTLVPGVRVDHVGDVDEWSVEPRLSSQLRVTDTTLLRGGVGLFAQPPQLGRTMPGFGNPDLGLERAVHTTVGAQQDLGGVVRLSLDGYFKHFFDRIVATPAGEPPHLVNDGVGRSYGAELAVRWIGDRRFSGYLAYTLSRSERRDRAEDWRAFDYDQTHVLTAALSYDLGDEWEVGATFRLTSGVPYTPIVGAAYDAGSDRYLPRYGAVNGARDPVWHRLDLRVAKTFVIDGSARIQLSLDLMNVTNHMAQGGLYHSYDYRETIAATGLPFVPNLGIRGEL